MKIGNVNLKMASYPLSEPKNNSNTTCNESLTPLDLNDKARVSY